MAAGVLRYVLAEMAEKTSDEILEEMEHEPKQDVEELLEFDEDTAGGLMNTEYVALPQNATVADALDSVKEALFKASANSWAEANLSAGTFSSACDTAAATFGGTFRRCVVRGRGSSVITLATTACAVGPVKGGSPDSIS